MNRALAGLLVAAMACTAGCTTYYQVHDPTTGRDYYTTDYNQRGSGTATLTDARTGNQVTLQNSEVKKISKEEFEVGKFAQPTATPTGAQAPANMSSHSPAYGQPAYGQQPP